MNSIMMIYPYKHLGSWVFDDAEFGLNKEPFIAGADDIISKVVLTKNIKNADDGFRIVFSATPFPDFDLELTWKHGDETGNYYYSEVFDMEGWLCPALFHYFEKAPEKLYAKFEEK